MQLREGSELQNGKYRILRVLGQGGFGITYLAENTFFEKKVAIKEFFPKDFCGRDNTSHLTLGTQNNAETVAKLKDRFLKEAKNIAKLDHPGIVKIHDIFEENNTAYYVMDYIEGENLNEMVKRNGPLSEKKAIEYIRKVGDALDYIHSRNMTHFDVKPANIMVRRSDDQPILIDFGLSKQYDMHGDATSTLMQGVSHGYSPIELYNPGSLSSFSPQTDVYSLGATLYFLLTGSVPPSASDMLENGITIPSTISEANAMAIRNAMAVSRGKRPVNVESFIRQLSSRSKNKKQPKNEDTIFINPQPQGGDSDISRIANNNHERNSKTDKALYAIMCVTALLLIALMIIVLVKTDKGDTINSYGNTMDEVEVVEVAIDSVLDSTVDTVVAAATEVEELTEMMWSSPLGYASYVGSVNAYNEPNGKGIAKILNGKYKGCIYDGEFVNGNMNGSAEYTQRNGDTFSGTFKNNRYFEGTYTIKESGEYFIGRFDNNGQPLRGQWYDRYGTRL